MTLTLPADEARRIILRAQGFLGADARRGGPPAALRRLGAVQLDTISVLARSHELVAYARLGAVGRQNVERAYWDEPARTFEYWCHAACILPIEDWPLYAFRRRAFRERRYRWHQVPPTVDKVLEQVRQNGPVTTADIGGAKNGGPWWDWSDSKIAIEWLLDTGEVVCTRRVGWRRVYELAERAVPGHLLGEDLSDAECVTRLAGVAGRALGIATRADLVDFLRLKAPHAALLDAALLDGGAGLVPVRVHGWPERAANAWADPAALESTPRGRHRTTLLSPFDSLIWDRARTARVFGFNHRLEAYVPKDKRVHGYFTMPVLAGGRLIGRVDPAREGSALVARQIGLEAGTDPRKAVVPLAEALREAAAWVGCDTVRIDRAEPFLREAILSAIP
ncbi:winged helix-turn-helix domain-containing protein [Planomonospora sp. ID67723]|uniref:winged helix-turn-helix domain-containing protein n=1 Tax=Planomonospora sp. ID67723 TaxID=2738134 RepID=UPI0018C3D5BC|nr:crosslink repair DNA glycosylase YcaQ family protein [Planomonospora sp. ID67723]MBG0828079.1 winged helix-turn-helix domain-containing protein [Planomonospora sp. ID67723]